MRNARQSPIVRIGGRYGLIAGGVLAVTLTALFYLGRHPLLIPLVFDLRILVFGIFLTLAMMEFRRLNGAVLHFWQGIAMGLVVYVLATFVTTMVLLAVGLIDPDFVDTYVSESIRTMEENRSVLEEGIGADRLNSAIENLPSTTANDLAFDYFLKSTPIGFILTLLTAVFLRQQPK